MHFTVKELSDKRLAADMVIKYHYAHRKPSIVYAYGLYDETDTLQGVCTYGMPVQRNVLSLCGEGYVHNVLELTRLFIHDCCARNTASWFIAQTWQLLKQTHPERFILVSYADSTVGHIGYVYQSTNWLYTGKTSPRLVGYDIAGRSVHRRTFYHKIGTTKAQAIVHSYPEAIPIRGLGKYRYVCFIGDRRQNKAARNCLKWKVYEEYPKTDKEEGHA
jgi:hypothetical protein